MLCHKLAVLASLCALCVPQAQEAVTHQAVFPPAPTDGPASCAPARHDGVCAGQSRGANGVAIKLILIYLSDIDIFMLQK